MKNFLLINPRFGTHHPPLGLAYLSSYVKLYYPGRWDFHLVDCAWQNDRDLTEAIGQYKPELIGITATTNTFLEAKRLAAFIRPRHKAPIILGGVHITAVPEDLLTSGFDLAVLGEGEETLLELLRHFDETGVLAGEQIAGLAFPAGSRLVKTPPRPLIPDLDRIPPPDYSLLAMAQFYTRPRALAHGFFAKGASLMPSRGCPYARCSFCSSEVMWGRKVRSFSPRRVYEEISHLVTTYGLNSVIFLDDNFTTKRTWLAELAAYLQDSDFFPHFRFDCESIAEFLDDDKAALLKSMGCERVEFGFESGNQRVLCALKHDKVRLEASARAIDICRRHGLKVLGNFIFGWFDETREEVAETARFIQTHPIDYLAWHTLAPYPGTRVWRLFEENYRSQFGSFTPEEFYNLETCNSLLPVHDVLPLPEATRLYQELQRQADAANTHIVHDLGLSEADRAELWAAVNRNMERRRINAPRLIRTRPNPWPAASPAPDVSLETTCRALEKKLPAANQEILEKFDLLAGHPWERHTQAEITNYYACLHALARTARPRKILEVGTGFGLSAAALLSACEPVELFISLDLGIFSGEYGFAENNIAYARRKISAWADKHDVLPDRLHFFKVNTQPRGKTDNTDQPTAAPPWREHRELAALLAENLFDVIFVDGKHTEDGLYHDLTTFWPFLRPGGLMLCDDLHDASYRNLYAWAGETLESFNRFTSARAVEIAEFRLWDFPRVMPPGREGLRPFGIIRKRGRAPAAAASLPASHPEPPAFPTAPALPDFTSLINTVARAEGLLYYRDQTPASLAALAALAREFRPTKIVELGTLYGLSLRAWLAAAPQAEIMAVDLSFAALERSLAAAPAALSRVQLVEGNILQLNFSSLWGPDDRVLLFVDAHDTPPSPLMAHILDHALPHLPPGSLVVVDDLWHSSDPLHPTNMEAFFARVVIDEIDPLQCLAGAYASYWQGGSFFGFPEVAPLLAFINARRLPLRLENGAKCISFLWPSPENHLTLPLEEIETVRGAYFHNPVTGISLNGMGKIVLDREALAALAGHLEGAVRYGRGDVPGALDCFRQATSLKVPVSGLHYAQAVCLARLKRFEEAAAALAEELATAFPHRRAAQFLADLKAWTAPSPETTRESPFKAKMADKATRAKRFPRLSPSLPKGGEGGGEGGVEDPRPWPSPQQTTAAGLTLFALPKAFRGHTGIIQQNAITSWTRLSPRPQIILCGDEEGTAAVARELGVRHEPSIAVTAHGTPLVNDLFGRAEALAGPGLLVYVNADIILLPDFLTAVAKVRERFSQFLIIGQRWDLEVTEPLDFADSGWESRLRSLVAAAGNLHAVSALDYFVFPKGLWPNLPAFALGRTAWDNWLAAQPLIQGLPVIDATEAVTAIHQNHDYGHRPGGGEEVWRGEEARRNQNLAWASPFLAYPCHATWELTASGLKERLLENQALALVLEGLASFERGEFTSALDRFAKALHLFPQGLPGLHYLQAQAFERLERVPEARTALERELASHPSHHRARTVLDRLTGITVAAGPVQPLISVVIPTHNRGRFIREALDSVFSQDGPALEVVVVDDGSTDDTAEIMASLQDPRLRFIAKEKTNAPDTRNRCIDAARGKWLLWLDADDMLLPGWLARLETVLTSGPEADVYYGNLVVVDVRGEPQKVLRYEDFLGRNEALVGRMIHFNPLPLGGSLVRRSLLLKAGGFDPTLPRAHDYELWTRLAARARFHHVPFLALKWRWHDSNLSSGSVIRDMSHEAEIVRRLLRRYRLIDLFPEFPWEADWQAAQARASLAVGEILTRYGDRAGARAWFEECRDLGLHPPDQPELLEDVSQAVGHKGGASAGAPPLPPSFRTAPLRLLLVAHNLQEEGTAGTEAYCLELGRALAARGLEVAFLAPAGPPAGLQETIPWSRTDLAGLPLFRFRRSNTDLAGSVRHHGFEAAFREILHHYPVDLVHFQHTYLSSISLIQVALEANLPVAVTLHDAWHLCPRLHCFNDAGFCGGPGSIDKCAACLERWSGAKGPEIRGKLAGFLDLRLDYVKALFSRGRVLAPSRFLRDLHYQTGVAPGEIVHLPLGLDSVGRPLSAPPASPPLFVFLGNLVEVKRVDVAVDAMIPLAGEAELMIWGQAPSTFEAGFLDHIAPHPHIRYQGPYRRADLPEILAGATAVIVSSDFENCPLVARESLMLGVPVVASRAGGLPEIVRHEENGLLFPPGDVQALTQALRRLCGDADLVEKLRQGITPVKSIMTEAQELADLYHLWTWERRHSTMQPQGCTAGPIPRAANPDQSAPDPRVSVIIPVHNNLALTRDCLASIREHRPDAALEIIVVDNGSTDGTPEFLAQEAAAGRLRVIRHEANLGFARACNQGAAAARGEYLLFLNNDTRVLPGWLDELVRALDQDPQVAAAGSKLLYPDGAIQHAGVVFNREKKVYHLYQGFPADHPAVNRPRDFQAVTAACMLVRQDLFMEAGLYDEGYVNGLEDVDLCFTLRQMGHRVAYIPTSVLIHLESRTPGRFAQERANALHFSAKWDGHIVPDDEHYLEEDGLCGRECVPEGKRFADLAAIPHV